MDEIIITAEELNAESLMRRYAELLKKPDVFPSRNNWNYITEHNMYQLAPLLYQKYIISETTTESNRSDFHDIAIELFPEYLKKIGYEHAVKTIYADTSTRVDLAIKLVIKLNLFNAKGISKMLYDGQRGAAAKMLAALQPEYTINDLRTLRLLLAQFANLPELGSVEKPKLSLLGGQGRYICPNGHANKADAEFCSNPECQLNIKGLTPDEVNCITDFADRIEILESMLKSRQQTSCQPT